MTTHATRRSSRHLGTFTIIFLAAFAVVAAVASIFGGMLVIVPVILFLGPVGVIGWMAFHERVLPDELERKRHDNATTHSPH